MSRNNSRRSSNLIWFVVLAVLVYCYVVKLPNPEFWHWITH